jgi:hypothetical protein
MSFGSSKISSWRAARTRALALSRYPIRAPVFAMDGDGPSPVWLPGTVFSHPRPGIIRVKLNPGMIDVPLAEIKPAAVLPKNKYGVFREHPNAAATVVDVTGARNLRKKAKLAGGLRPWLNVECDTPQQAIGHLRAYETLPNRPALGDPSRRPALPSGKVQERSLDLAPTRPAPAAERKPGLASRVIAALRR